MTKREAREFRKQLILALVGYDTNNAYKDEMGNWVTHARASVDIADEIIEHMTKSGYQEQYDEGAEPLR